MKRRLTNINPVILQGDCLDYFKAGSIKDIDLTFFDPPYNQGKDYKYFDDEQNPEEYWKGIEEVLDGTYKATVDGGAIYFMHREKNAEFILSALRKTKWTYQNTIIWKKQTSAVPGRYRFGKSYQVIVFATKGKKPRVFNRLRIDPPLPPHYKYKRKNGMYVTDIWADTKVVPVPAIGSKTVSSGSEDERIILVKRATGDCCLCILSPLLSLKGSSPAK